MPIVVIVAVYYRGKGKETTERLQGTNGREKVKAVPVVGVPS